MKWLVVLCLLASPAAASTNWLITTNTGDVVTLDAMRTSTGYRTTLHAAKNFYERAWRAIPCPGSGEQPAGDVLIEMERQADGSYNVKLFKGRMYTAGPNGMGADPVTACVFDSPLTYKGNVVDRATATAVDRTQVERYPRDHDTFMVLTSTFPPCPVPDSAKRTCLGVWPVKPIIDMPMLDTDGDGIFDEWEINGIRDGSNWLDLRSMGANPDHKDLFVQVDAHPEAVLYDEVPTQLRNYFASLPVTNPDGRLGIALHLDNGRSSIMTGTRRWDALSRANQNVTSFGDHFTTADTPTGCQNPDKTPLTNLMRSNLEPLRAKVFRYVILAKWVVPNHDCYSGMNWNIPSKAFVIGDWAETSIADGDVQLGLLMHELGHSLGLFHAGGSDQPRYKPNYLSVMNYLYQERGIPQPDDLGLYVYSTSDPTPANSIDEVTLTDDAGLPAVGPRRTLLRFACRGDDNAALTLIAPGVATDLRCDGPNSPAPNDITASDGNNPTRLETYNDVAHLRLPLEDGPATWAAGRSIAPEGRSLIKALQDYGVQIGDAKPPTVKLALKKKGKKRRLTLKAQDDKGLASAVISVGGAKQILVLSKLRKRTKSATKNVDIDASGDVTVVVTDIATKSVTATAK